jgi:hypothetical protein
MKPRLTTSCTRPATRVLSYTNKGLGGRVMPGVRSLLSLAGIHAPTSSNRRLVWLGSRNR